jgi:hypothetical protein
MGCGNPGRWPRGTEKDLSIQQYGRCGSQYCQTPCDAVAYMPISSTIDRRFGGFLLLGNTTAAACDLANSINQHQAILVADQL